MFEGVIYDSSHIVGRDVILKAIARRRKLKELRLSRSGLSRSGKTAGQQVTARNNTKKDFRTKEDDDTTRVFNSDQKPQPQKTVLAKYDSNDKTGNLYSIPNDTLGYDKHETEPHKNFNQSFKMATEEDEKKDAREQKNDDASEHSHGISQFT